MQTTRMCELLRQVSLEVIEPRFQALSDHQVDQKKPGDYVTIADRESEVFLTRAIVADDPTALVVGEEATFEDPTLPQRLPVADVAWVVDPVDGTANFVRGSDDFAVMVAELRSGVTVRAWIYQPRYGRMFVAEAGAGVTCNDEPVLPLLPSKPYRGAVSPIDLLGWDAPDVAPAVQHHFSCGIDYPALVLGTWDYLAYSHTRPWDHLPGALMVRELGGVVRARSGVEYGPGIDEGGLTVAASEDVWEHVRTMWDS